MSIITREQAKDLRNAFQCWQQDYDPVEDKEQYDMFRLGVVAMETLLESMDLERGKIRRFDLDMSNCDSCGQDCGADMIEDFDGEYVLWDEVLPHLYRYDEYTAPPAPVSVPAAMEMDDDFDSSFEHGKAVGWNAYRAAMIQGADGTLTNEGTIPVTQFKPVADLYGLTSPTGGETSFTFDAVEARDFIDGGWSCQEYVELERFQEAVIGNSPVIQDGWKLVPIDPTKDMLRAGQSVVGFWLNTVHCYSKMLAAAPAAPQQEDL
ncbi:TPA: hypothetical protein N2N35_000852 [Enterobacter cloacae]|nr:hypothetical protein [Enterobacter cloacae]